MLKQDKEVPFNGDFEDTDLEDEDDDFSQGSESDDDHPQVKKQKKKKITPMGSTKKIVMNVSDTQYPVVKFVGKKLYKFKLQYTPYLECNTWDLCWTDQAVLPETLAKMQSHQKINHFPGMYALARKNHLGRNLMKMLKQFPDAYDFFPRTWLLPSEYGDFKAQFQKGKAKTFIVKPEASCQGRGIFLTRSIDSINPQEHYVVQRYVHKPLLVDDLKFDFRIYVLLAGCDPLKIYLYKEGLARFATQAYVPPHSTNLDDVCMHLTNYAINKDSPNFVFNEDEKNMDLGHKRSLTSVMTLFRNQGRDVDKLNAEIKDLIVKTFCAVQPILQSNYTQMDNFANNMCFEVLGFDILLDSDFKPILLEVNHTPSFTTDTPLDAQIKKNLIRDTIKLMNINLKTKTELVQLKKDEMQRRVLTGKKTKYTTEEKKTLKRQAQQERDEYELQHMGGYERIYPSELVYDEYLQYALKLYEEWTGANIRRNVKKVDEQPSLPPRPNQQQQQQQQQPKVLTKSVLYKNVQSKVFTNINPPKLEIPKGNEVEQEGAEQLPMFREMDNFIVGEDDELRSKRKTLCQQLSIQQNQQMQFQQLDEVIMDYHQINNTVKYHSLQPVQSQSGFMCLSPLVMPTKQQGPTQKKFSIRKPSKPRMHEKRIYESDQEPEIMISKPNVSENSRKDSAINNGSFIKPKLFSLKLHQVQKGSKLQSLPILIQQNYGKFRYD